MQPSKDSICQSGVRDNKQATPFSRALVQTPVNSLKSKPSNSFIGFSLISPMRTFWTAEWSLTLGIRLIPSGCQRASTTWDHCLQMVRTQLTVVPFRRKDIRPNTPQTVRAKCPNEKHCHCIPLPLSRWAAPIEWGVSEWAVLLLLYTNAWYRLLSYCDAVCSAGQMFCASEMCFIVL